MVVVSVKSFRVGSRGHFPKPKSQLVVGTRCDRASSPEAPLPTTLKTGQSEVSSHSFEPLESWDGSDVIGSED